MVKTIPKHVVQLLHSPVRIQCTTEEFPEYATFEWRHDGKTYRNDTGSPRRNVYVEKNGLLVIQQVTAAENGSWTCEAKVRNVSMGKAQASIHVEGRKKRIKNRALCSNHFSHSFYYVSARRPTSGGDPAQNWRDGQPALQCVNQLLAYSGNVVPQRSSCASLHTGGPANQKE